MFISHVYMLLYTDNNNNKIIIIFYVLTFFSRVFKTSITIPINVFVFNFYTCLLHRVLSTTVINIIITFKTNRLYEYYWNYLYCITIIMKYRVSNK